MMQRAESHLREGVRSLAAGAALALVFAVVPGAPALSQCAGLPATAGADDIVCDPGAGEAIDALGGNDTVILDSGTLVSITGNADDDLLTVNGGSLDAGVLGGSGLDTIAINGGEIGGSVSGESGNDQIALTAGSVGGDVTGGSSDDVILLSGTAFVAGALAGGSGNDSLGLATGQVGGNLLGDSGSDTLSVGGGALGGHVQGGLDDDQIAITGGSIGGSIFGDGGNDTLELVSIGTISGGVHGGAENDIVRIHGLNDGGNFDQALAGLDELSGGDGLDQLEFLGAIAQLPVSYGGFETVMLLQGASGNSLLDVFNGSNLRVLTSDLVYSSFSSRLEASNGGGGLGGDLTITGDYAGTGFTDMRDGTDTNDRVTVNGNYAGGVPAALEIDASLDAANDADLLVIEGAIADIAVGGPLNIVVPAGVTLVSVADVGTGIGILTGDGPGAGIAVVDVSNTGLTDDDDFRLLGEPLEAGAVEYFLDLESDGIWYLQSVFQDQVFGYAATQSAVNYMTRDYMGTLQERVGTREQTWTGGATKISEGMGVWLRGGGTFGTVNADSNAGAFGLNEYDYDHFFGQLGLDVPFAVTETGRFVGSVFGQAGYGDIKAQDEEGNDAAESEITAYGGGFSITYYGGGEDWAGQPGPHAGAGLYADLVAVFNWYDADVSDTAGADQGHKGTVEGWGWGAGLEVGYGFFLNNGLRLVPQAQLSYSASYLDNFVDDDGIDVDFGDGSSLEVRGGIQVDSGKMWRSGNAYVEANIVHEFLADYDLTVSTLDAGGDLSGTSAELGIGGSFSFVDNVGGYVDIDYRIPFDNGRQGVGAIAGIKVNW